MLYNFPDNILHTHLKKYQNLGQDKIPGLLKSASNVSISRNHSGSELTGEMHHHNLAFMKKIPPGAEASNILVGEVDFLDKTVSAFIRLSKAQVLGDLTEVPVPTRFLFLLLGPTNSQLGNLICSVI